MCRYIKHRSRQELTTGRGSTRGPGGGLTVSIRWVSYVASMVAFERFEELVLGFTSVVYGRQTRDASVQFTVGAVRR